MHSSGPPTRDPPNLILTNGISPIGLVAVVRMDHSTDWSSSCQPLQLLLEDPGLEAPQDLRVGAFGLDIAPGVRYRSIADLRSKVSTLGFEKVTSKLRAVICDDAVGDPEAAHEALDELDSRAGWDGTDGFHFRPLGELVDGDVKIAVAPWRPRERA